jgi:hypothetical protein
VREFITFSRHCDYNLPVFVGHSLFFKEFCSKRISAVMCRKRPHLSANLKRYRLSNASLLAVTVKYADLDNGCSEAVVVDADLIFGGGFHGLKLAHEKTGKAAAGRYSAEAVGAGPASKSLCVCVRLWCWDKLQLHLQCSVAKVCAIKLLLQLLWCWCARYRVIASTCSSSSNRYTIARRGYAAVRSRAELSLQCNLPLMCYCCAQMMRT